MCKASAQYCQACGAHWQQASYAGHRGTWQGGRERWEPPARGKSPRARGKGQEPWRPAKGQPKGPKSPRRRGNGQGRESHADPAPSVSGDSSSGILLPQASRQQLLKDLPAAPQAPKPALPSSQVVEPWDRLPQGVQDLMQMLAQQKEELPASVKELLEAQLAADHKQTAKQLHRLVTQQSQARRSLESCARLAAFLLRSGWLSATIGRVASETNRAKERGHAPDGSVGGALDVCATVYFQGFAKTVGLGRWHGRVCGCLLLRRGGYGSGCVSGSGCQPSSGGGAQPSAGDGSDAGAAGRLCRRGGAGGRVPRADPAQTQGQEQRSGARSGGQARACRDTGSGQARRHAGTDRKSPAAFWQGSETCHLDLTEPSTSPHVSYTSIVGDSSFVSRWWAPVLALGLQAEVAMLRFDIPSCSSVFEINDARAELCLPLTTATSVWSPLLHSSAAGAAESEGVDPVSCDVVSTFRSSSERMWSSPGESTDVVETTLRGAGGQLHSQLPLATAEPLCTEFCVLQDWHARAGCFHTRRHPLPLKVRFIDSHAKSWGNVWRRQLASALGAHAAFVDAQPQRVQQSARTALAFLSDGPSYAPPSRCPGSPASFLRAQTEAVEAQSQRVQQPAGTAMTFLSDRVSLIRSTLCPWSPTNTSACRRRLSRPNRSVCSSQLAPQ